MGRSFASVLVVTAIMVSGQVADARGQWIHAAWGYGHYHHHYHGVPYCGGGVVVWEPFVPAPVFETWLVPAAPVIVQPIDLPLGARQHQVGGENFARKEMIPGNRVVGQDGGIAADFNDPGEIRRRAAVLKPSTPAGRMRADRSISSGDQAFAEQNLARATGRYREAIGKAPDYSEAHFRLAHAYVATRRYNLALKSVLVALELAGTSRPEGFSLEDMYQGDQFARQQHLKRLVDASLREPTDGGLQFLIGFTLYYDAQRDAAQDYFRAAKQLEGIHQDYVHHFLPVQRVAEPQEAAN